MNQQIRYFFIFSLCAIIGIGVFFLLPFVQKQIVEKSEFEKSPEKPDVTDESKTFVSPPSEGNTIYISDEKPGSTITADFVVLAEGGFVVIHKDADGTPGAIIGSSGYMRDLNEHTVIKVERATTDGEVLYAMLHLDNGDRAFDPLEDPPIQDMEGNILLRKFDVSKSANKPIGYTF